MPSLFVEYLEKASMSILHSVTTLVPGLSRPKKADVSPDHAGWGPRSIAFSCLKKVAEFYMVYGRCNERGL